MKRIGFTLPRLHANEVDYTMPYGIAIMSALAKQRGAAGETFYSDNVEELLSADEVWCTGLTEAWGEVNRLGKRVVEAGKRFRVGGHHATALPWTLAWGEACPGAYEDLTDIDHGPLPDWDVFPDFSSKRAMLVTSYGCPFSCRFCSSKAFWKGYVTKSPARIVAEIRALADRGVADIVLFDDLFTARVKHLQEVVERVEAEGLNSIAYSCLVRADSVTPEVLELLHRMHVTDCAFGAESGSDVVLQSMNKKTTVAQNQLAVDRLNAGGYLPTIGLVIGFPGETSETLAATKRFIEKNRSKTACIDVYGSIPLPGTWLWERFMEKYHPNLHDFPWESLRIRADSADWERYPIMSECDVEELKDLCEWNKREKAGNTPEKREESINTASAVTLRDLFKWVEGLSTDDITCKMCGYSGKMPKVIEVGLDQPNTSAELKKRSCQDSFLFHRCPNCECLIPYPFSFTVATNDAAFNYKIPDDKIGEGIGGYLAELYVSVFAGIDFMVSPLQCITTFPYSPTMLDVGCGFGFSLLYAKTMLNAHCCGYEPSLYGKYGKQLLNLDIRDAYFSPDGKTYDIVYCSEVIEHVENPNNFLNSLCMSLNDNGILILTTPCADKIYNGTLLSYGQILESAQAGTHYYIQSIKSIKNALDKYQFKKIEVFSYLNRLIVIASKGHDFDINQFDDRNKYIHFLKKVSESKNYFHPLLYNGIIFRLFKEDVNQALWEDAENILSLYEKYLSERFGEEAAMKDAIRMALQKARYSIEEMMSRLRNISLYNYPIFLFYRALFRMNYKGDLADAARDCADASELCLLLWRTTPATALEYGTTIWPAKFHEGLCHARMGDKEKARECWQRILDNMQLPLAEPELLERCRKELDHLNETDRQAKLPSSLESHPLVQELLARDFYLPELVEAYSEKRMPHTAALLRRALNDYQGAHGLARNFAQTLSFVQAVVSEQRRQLKEMKKEFHETRARLVPFALAAQRIAREITPLARSGKRAVEVTNRVLSLPVRGARFVYKICRHPVAGWSMDYAENLPGFTELEAPDTFSFVLTEPVTQRLTLPHRAVSSVSLHLGRQEGAPTGICVDIHDGTGKHLLHGELPGYRLHSASWCAVPLTGIYAAEPGITVELRISPLGAGIPVVLQGVIAPEAQGMRFGNKTLPRARCEIAFPAPPPAAFAQRDLLIVTPDDLSKTRIGLAMRHWEMARALSHRGYTVTLTSCAKQDPDLQGENFEVAAFSKENVPDLIAGHRVVLTQGPGIFHLPDCCFSGQKLIVDMVTPMHFENIGISETRYDEGYRCALEGLRRGDFLVCGNESQRLYWLGLLSSMNRTGVEENRRDPSMKKLIDVVGFGIRETRPVMRRHGIRNAETGFTENDFILLWYGGIWDWLDPAPFLKAVHAARESCPNIKVYFSMFCQKGKTPTAAALAARESAQRLGLLGHAVYFRPEPVPYSEAENYLLDANLGVFFQQRNMETRLSARTRIYDYIWANLPVLMNRGDETSELLLHKQPDLILESYAEESIAQALVRYINNPQKQHEYSNNLVQLHHDLLWENQVGPIDAFLRANAEEV